MGQFRKKPVLVDAVQFSGGYSDEIEAFIPRSHREVHFPGAVELRVLVHGGWATPDYGDWIVKETGGEFGLICYVVPDDIFSQTYERVE